MTSADSTVSVVISHYPGASITDLWDAVDSLLQQTREPSEIIVVVDESHSRRARVEAYYEDEEAVEVVFKEEDTGLAASRNLGATHSSGDIVAFLDDDAIASEVWVEKIVEGYGYEAAVGVGGPAYPLWPDERPILVPVEFDWLVGAGPYHDEAQTVRNTYGCNFSVRRDAFEFVGGFDERFGKQAVMLQGEEAELADRVRTTFNGEVWYHPEAVVEHKVDEEQMELSALLERAYWQGVSKKYIEQITEFDNSDESSFLKELFLQRIPERMRRTMSGDKSAGQVALLAAYTTAVGLGYLHGPPEEVTA